MGAPRVGPHDPGEVTVASKGETLKRLRREIEIKQRDLTLISGVAQYRRTLWRLADALDTIGSEGAVGLLDGDWRPHRGKMSSFVRLTLHIAARM